jgi:hypothetical protein
MLRPNDVLTQVTLFTKVGGPLTKRISLAPDGTLVSDGSACLMGQGWAERVWVQDIDELKDLLARTTSEQALALGALRDDLPTKARIVTERSLNGQAQPGIIARTQANIVYDKGPAFALLDHDRKGMPASVAGRLKQLGGFWPAILTVMPELAHVARVTRTSTSSGLIRTDTGKRLAGSGGLHVFVAVQDGTDIRRFLQDLHARCWLAGLGWMMVSKSGSLLDRSIIDRMVYGPERLVFEGPPILEGPLKQDKNSRRPVAVEGELLDTAATCLPLTLVEKSQVEDLKSRERQRLNPEASKVRAAFVATQMDKLVKRTGASPAAAKQVVTRWCDGVLLPDIELEFDDEDLRGCTVGDVLAEPEKFLGATLADPLEGVEYGRTVAKILRRSTGELWIHSFAHGKTVYDLKHDVASVRRSMEAAAEEDVLKTFTRMVVMAAVDAEEMEELRRLASKLSGCGVNTVKSALKAAQAEYAKKQAEARRKALRTFRQDPRVALPVPQFDDERLPVMKTLNEILGSVKLPVPPLRNIDGVLAHMRKIAVPNTHAFRGKKDEEPPAQWLLTPMTELEAEELIERHIDFYEENAKTGNRRSVSLPMIFVQHYLQRFDGVLPTAVAIATLPIVLPDGELLAPDGLDRERGIIFNIPKELRTIIPRREDCTPEKVKAAMKFLCDEWLVDVLVADDAGLYTIIALALTLIQRSLLSDRPCFFNTAGRRGGGKTTLVKMVIQAVTGEKAAGSAWSKNIEERRKSLLSYLMAGPVYILWDNIERGSRLSCPYIEKSCTEGFYVDRKLGVSETVRASAASIHIFTGNNVGPKAGSDLASRSLQTRLDVTRPDPENREFKHPNILDWTDTHRAQILNALFTILLGNPELRKPHDAQAKTRFKQWWRLVGSAVEHAAEVMKAPTDFKKQFLEQEEVDDGGVSLADALIILADKWPQSFLANDLAEFINKEFPDDIQRQVREFLYPNSTDPKAKFSSKSVGTALGRHIDEPVASGGKVYTLRRYQELHGKSAAKYRVDIG